MSFCLVLQAQGLWQQEGDKKEEVKALRVASSSESKDIPSPRRCPEEHVIQHCEGKTIPAMKGFRWFQTTDENPLSLSRPCCARPRIGLSTLLLFILLSDLSDLSAAFQYRVGSHVRSSKVPSVFIPPRPRRLAEIVAMKGQTSSTQKDWKLSEY
jgi:hypothetical protein